MVRYLVPEPTWKGGGEAGKVCDQQDAEQEHKRHRDNGPHDGGHRFFESQ